jgi:lysozyme
MWTELINQLKRDEGLRLDAYRDSLGVLTVGYGHNVQARPVAGVEKEGDTISEGMAYALLTDDLARTMQALDEALPWVDTIDDARKAVLYNMAFNLGVRGLLKWRNTLMAVREGRYNDAADAMMQSKWAYQVGDGPGGYFDRGERLVKQMRTGEWQ